MLITLQRNCPWCSCNAPIKSRFHTLEIFFAIFLLRPVRCGTCYHRYWRPIFYFARQREEVRPAEAGRQRSREKAQPAERNHVA